MDENIVREFLNQRTFIITKEGFQYTFEMTEDCFVGDRTLKIEDMFHETIYINFDNINIIRRAGAAK